MKWLHGMFSICLLNHLHFSFIVLLFISTVLYISPPKSILSASLLFFASTEVSDWCDSTQQANTYSRCAWISYATLNSGSFVWAVWVCVHSWNSREGESIPSPTDFLSNCTELRRKDTPCTGHHTVFHQHVSLECPCPFTLRLMRSLLHAVIAPLWEGANIGNR